MSYRGKSNTFETVYKYFLQTLICSSLINCKPNVIFLKMETLKEYTSGLFVPIKKYIYILIISKLKQFSRKIIAKNTCPSTNRTVFAETASKFFP